MKTLTEKQEQEQRAELLDEFGYLESHEKLQWVYTNLALLKELGGYERFLSDAYTGHNMLMSTYHFSPATLLRLFQLADKEMLRSHGDPLPDDEFITLYRGVRDVANKASIRSMSWTSNSNTAAWFAEFLNEGTEAGVYTATVHVDSVFLYTNDTGEEEYVIEVPKGVKVKRVHPMPEPKQIK